MRRVVWRTLGACVPCGLAMALIVAESCSGVQWLARDGRLRPLGDAQVLAPVPFHGSPWSVWARVGREGGWARTVRVGGEATTLTGLVGLHPDFYEVGRCTRVVAEARVETEGTDTVVASVELLPVAERRYKPFVPMQASLEPWESTEARVVMWVRNEGPGPVEVFWVEPKVVRSRP